ncbi:MAG: hypothetical protein HY298_13450 [Verrucomicrobia bacterium]|nr:hypothetical protein [Verrucomicrobiota bacterium]
MGGALDFLYMFQQVDTKDPAVVELEVQSRYLAMFPRGDRYFVPRAFGWAIDSFTGNCLGYQAIDASYHDFEHTLQGTLCMVRLLHGRHQARARPVLSQRIFELGLLAILLHDTGYLKRRDDREGTGAKYTVIHVSRSADFAAELLAQKGFGKDEIKSVQNMIRCTGVNANLEAIPFQSDLEKTAGFALGTADLLGQMAAEDYVQKLPELYSEFAEAARFSGGDAGAVGTFSNAADLIQKTPGFWDKYVREKIESDFGGLYQFLNVPYPDGPNFYLDRIESHMAQLRQQLTEATA